MKDVSRFLLLWVIPVLLLAGCSDTRILSTSRHQFKLIADSAPQEISTGTYLVGWIRILPLNAAGEAQMIPVRMDEPYIYWPQWGLEIQDVNFDGYDDIAVRQHKGAKWGRLYWWLYDNNTSRFETNSLTDELSSLICSTFIVDSDARLIKVTELRGVEVIETVYRVGDGHLIRN